MERGLSPGRINCFPRRTLTGCVSRLLALACEVCKRGFLLSRKEGELRMLGLCGRVGTVRLVPGHEQQLT